MTSEQYDKLNVDDKERLVLKLWGWRDLHFNDYAVCDAHDIGLKFRGDLGPHINLACPNVLIDLNGMHEAENTMTEEQHDRYADMLVNICNSRRIHRATAAQRAKAFALIMSEERDT